ncbi:hypothetical protein [uncultured Tateyamaria sp.]|uniref:hypothetical protein n=1 Tax=uncultured Tateyamaria sp. TaxID=455651 RepID=UPI0026108CA2|nr:hypothetical protein [uncultured Tateyamaria sp.]
MPSKGGPLDPKGLIFEAYQIDGITKPECRSIFLDWALSLGDGITPQAAIAELLTVYEGANPEHPMTQVLTEGLDSIAQPRRRGGWRSRSRPH